MSATTATVYASSVPTAIAAAPVIMAAMVINEMIQTGGEYMDLLEKTKQREAERLLNQQNIRAAKAQRLNEIHSRISLLEQRIERLCALTGEDAAPPSPPPSGSADAASWSAYAQTLESLLTRLENELSSRCGKILQKALENVTEAPSLENVLALYLARRQAETGEAQEANWRETANRVLLRLNLAQGEPLPVHLEMLARDIILADTPAHAELLTNELRLGVQKYRKEQETLRQDAEDATKWLSRFPEDALPESLRGLLAEAASGLSRLDEKTRQQIEALLARFEAEEAAQIQAASAIVLEQSLKDLGYQVEGIDETLFLEGGMAHFQRPGWNDYHVRLRVNAKEKTLNFNVIRAREKNDAPENAHEKRDFIAEDRWCAEYPKLAATLAARGLELKTLRTLGAGEIPVQLVEPEKIPHYQGEEEDFSARQNPLKMMPLPKR